MTDRVYRSIFRLNAWFKKSMNEVRLKYPSEFGMSLDDSSPRLGVAKTFATRIGGLNKRKELVSRLNERLKAR